MTLAAAIAAANGKFTGFKTVVDNLQTAFYAEYGRYWQGLSSHTTLPSEGNNASADNFDSAPPDHAGVSWNFAPGGALNGLFTAVRVSLNGVGSPMAGRVNYYTTSQGDGYEVEGWFTHTGTTYRRRDSVGPARGRDTGGTFVAID